MTISEWYFIPPAEAAERRRRAEERAEERRLDKPNTQPPVSVLRWTDSEQTTAQTSTADDVNSEADQRTEAEVTMEDENIETPEKTVFLIEYGFLGCLDIFVLHSDFSILN